MKTRILFAFFLLVASLAFHAEVLPCAPEADGAEIVGLWNFSDSGDPAQDFTMNFWTGHKMNGKTVEYAPGAFAFQPCIDEGDVQKAYGIAIDSNPQLIPDGAMAFEVWFNFDKGVNELKRTRFMLFDKKIYFYQIDKEGANSGYMVYFDRSGSDKYKMTCWLGFGDKSVEVGSEGLVIPAGGWHCAAMTYNGHGGFSLYLDGNCVRHVEFPEGHGSLAQNNTLLTIGDRSTSNHTPFAGLITQAVLYKGIPNRYGMRPIFEPFPGKNAFYRFDEYPGIRLRFSNTTEKDFNDVRFFQDGKELTDMYRPEIKNGKFVDYDLTVDTSLKAGKYSHLFRVEYQADGTAYSSECRFDYDLVARPTPYMPMVMWNATDDPALVKDIGFTSDMVVVGSMGRVRDTGAPVPAEENTRYAVECELFNSRARLGLRNIFWMIPGSWLSDKLKDDPAYARLNRAGKPIPNTNADVSLPIFRKFVEDVGRTVAMQFGSFTSVEGALIHSEVRDHSAISFRPEDVAAAEAATGAPIPEIAADKNSVDYHSIPNFPLNRVVPSDDPILKFYSWWWKHGDGWNDLHSILSKSLKSTGRNDLWTFFDPGVRTPSVWGNGGDVDIISQWTYSYPDPIKIGESTDELFAMVEGNPNQKVMKMTQVIWYRNKTAPVEKMPADEAERKEWEKVVPEAKFVTIAPDHLSIALWSMLARPVRGIMYHGWQSLVDRNATKQSSYKFTNSETAPRLKELAASVVKPLGPMLLEVGDRKADVAMLESFASQIYTDCGSWGWSDSWEADMHLILQWAGYQPQVVYEETIRKNTLDQFRVLVMPNCEVLPQDIVDAIHDFQKKGGIVVADRKLCPAVIPDYVVPTYTRRRQAKEDKEALQERSAELRKILDSYLSTPFLTSNMDLVGRMRQHGTTDYFFLMNDKRTYGDYLGQYHLVMEKGLPNSGRVALARKEGFVYDLVQHSQVEVSKDAAEGLSWDVEMGAGEGKLFMVSAVPLEVIHVTAPKKAARGEEFFFQVAVGDNAGALSDAVVPLKVTITTPEGETEGTGYYAAVDGMLTASVAPAKNDLPGTWTIQVQDLASGNSAFVEVQVK